MHRVDLTGLAAAAAAAEKEGDITAALASWRRALELLPRKTDQYATIEKRMKELSAVIHGHGPIPEGVGVNQKGRVAGKAAAVGAVGLALVKSKALLTALLANGKLLILGLLKLPTLLSLLFYARWMSGSSVGFGLGLVASIYVHEVGHVAALRRYGIEASAPMFVPGLGAFVRMNQYPTDAHEEARIGLAGPLWGLVAAITAAIIGRFTGSVVTTSVASVGATVNLFNLIPFWVLDGARGLRALARGERFVLAAVATLSSLSFHQWTPGIIAMLIFVRAFGRDAHEKGDRRMLALFAALVIALTLVSTLPVST
ncbi:MAG TPA: site-2 protease family protein [Polyangiaceae bacterium]|nr:site-2 protease family protein [Polyangiaceae bacterium]